MFGPPRIREVRETVASKFERPADFCINDYLDVGFRKVRGDGPGQTVRLRFTARLPRYVREKEWHPTQKQRSHADGALTLTFSVNHLLEVKRWACRVGTIAKCWSRKSYAQKLLPTFERCCNAWVMPERSYGDEFMPLIEFHFPSWVPRSQRIMGTPLWGDVQLVPKLHTHEMPLRIGPIRGTYAGKGMLRLEPRGSRLRIRLQPDDLPAVLPLAGKSLDLDGHALRLWCAAGDRDCACNYPVRTNGGHQGQ